MLRYKRLILSKLEPPDDAAPMQLRELARATGIPVPSMHNYAQFDTLPRVENVQKLADYFHESVSSLFSEDDDLTTHLVALVRTLNAEQKQALTQHIKQESP